MLGLLADIAIGIASGFFGILLLQSWPPRHRWSRDISWTIGEPSGQPIYQVKLYRRAYRFWKKRQGPIDVSFKARVAVKGIGFVPTTEHIVNVPCYKDWRPVVGRAVLVKFMAHECESRDLRYFPDEVRRRRSTGELTLADLLGVGEAELRVYVFAYRAKTGNRWMRRRKYRAADIKAGVFEKGSGHVVDASDGLPPWRPDLEDEPRRLRAPREETRQYRFGTWTVKVSRGRRGEG